MIKYLTIILCLATSQYLTAQPGRGGDNPRHDERIESMRIAFITNALDLSADEAKTFWPIYDDFSEKRRGLHEQMRSQGYNEDITDAQAKEIIQKHLDMEEAEVKLKRDLVDDLKGVISDRKIARLFVAEGKMKRELMNSIKNRMRDRREGRGDKRMR